MDLGHKREVGCGIMDLSFLDARPWARGFYRVGGGPAALFAADANGEPSTSFDGARGMGGIGKSVVAKGLVQSPEIRRAFGRI